MTLEELNKQVIQAISEQLDYSIEEITVDKKIISDLGADSLERFELIMALEDEFGIKINDTELFDLTDWSSQDKTIGEIQTFIQSKVSHTP
jgi:acyl carrier protein